MKALANIVKHTLHKQPNKIHYHKNTNQEPTSDYPSEDSVILSATNHHLTENFRNESTESEIDENHRTSHKGLPF